MAIVRSAGTEIIRSINLATVDGTSSELIVGVQHHIYTVLSVIFYAQAVQASGNYVNMRLVGYDSRGGTTNINHYIFRQDMSQQQTFVWDTKFSFNGFEPIDFAGPMDDATKQDAIADQGSGVAQYLSLETDSVNTTYDVVITYIDQNNS